VLAVLAELQPEESPVPQGFVHQAEEAFVPNPVVPDPVVPAHQLSKRMQRGVSCVVLRRLSSRVVLRRLSSQRRVSVESVSSWCRGESVSCQCCVSFVSECLDLD
jgi:hypothetical protein